MAKKSYAQLREEEIRLITRSTGASYNLVTKAYDEALVEDRGKLTNTKRNRMELVTRVVQIYQKSADSKKTEPRALSFRIDYPQGIGITVSGFDDEDDPAETGLYLAKLVEAQVESLVSAKDKKGLAKVILEITKASAQKENSR